MPALRAALEWIADNDDPTELDAEHVRGLISVALVADLWNKEAEKLAKSIVRLRRKSLKAGGA